MSSLPSLMISSSWIDELLEATSEAETPTSFIRWAGLCAIAASIRNKVYIQKGGIYKLYPNIYVLLVAKSGLRKGLAASVSKQLVSKVGNTRLISGRNSIQSIIQQLGTAYTLPSGGPPIVDSTAFINSGEFSTILIRDPDALTILTDLYDGHYNEVWKNTLKGSGIEELKNVCLTLLGALNQTHFSDLISHKDITGGFIARCIIVLEERRSRKNALLRPSNKVFDPASLAVYLKEISKLSGPFNLDEGAIKVFEEWYDKFEPETLDDKTGTANRIHDQILKVVQLIALSRRCALQITEEDMLDAMELTLGTSVNVERVTLGTGLSEKESGAKTKVFILSLLNAEGNKLTRRQTLKKHYGDFDAFDLDKIVLTLEEAGAIQSYSNGKEITYKLSHEIVDHFTRLEKRKS